MNRLIESKKKFSFNFLFILKGFILAAISSSKWERPIVKSNFGEEDDHDNDENNNQVDDDDEETAYLNEQKRNKLFLEDQASSLGKFG